MSRFLCTLSAFIMTLSLVGCNAAPADLPADGPATLTGQGGFLTMWVTLPHTVLRPKELLRAEMTVTNLGSEPAAIHTECQGQVRFTVLDDKGKSILPAEVPRACPMLAMLLGPGETKTFAGEVRLPDRRGQFQVTVTGPAPDLKAGPVAIYVG